MAGGLFSSPGKNCHPGAIAQWLKGVDKQGALQRGLCGVSHRSLGLARSLAPALQPAHGDAGERRLKRSPRRHASAYRYWRPSPGFAPWIPRIALPAAPPAVTSMAVLPNR